MKKFQEYFYCLSTLIFGLLVSCIIIYTTDTYASQGIKKKSDSKNDNRIVELNIGEGDNKISISFALSNTLGLKENPIKVKEKLTLNNSIVDFEFPSNKLKSNIRQTIAGGKQVINEIEISSVPNKNQTIFLVRYTTKGTGGGTGNIGISLVAAFSLDNNILSLSENLLLKIPCQGNLVHPNGKLKKIEKHITEDLKKVGAKSKSYTGSIWFSEKCSYLYGFAIFDPTNPESKNDAYFEFSSLEDTAIWSLGYVSNPAPDAEAYFKQGNTWWKKGDYNKAISYYSKALELEPNGIPAYINRGSLLSEKGEYDKALLDFNKVIELDPKFAVAYKNRGLTWYEKGEYDKAISDYSKAIELDPNYVDAYYNRGNARYRKVKYDKAISDYSKALELDPNYASAYLNRGLAWEHKGMKKKAADDYNHYLRIAGNKQGNAEKIRGWIREAGYTPKY